MERWQFIGWGIAASVLAHFLLAGAIFLSTDVHTYDQAAPDPIPVDVVSEEPEKAPEPTPTPSPDLVLPKPAASSSPQPAPSQQAAAPAQPSPQPMPQPSPRETAKPQAEPAPQPQPQQQPPPQQQPQPQPQPEPSPQSGQGYIPAQPDLTVRYGVMLGLPDALPPLAVTADKRDDDKEAGATATKNLSTDLVTTFRQHLRSCSRLPASIAPGDNVRVKLRVVMTPDGRIAGEPVLIEGTASLKGVDLKQGAVSALTACQPYAMLPADRYREWRVLELSFTPQDFAS
jgi:outer membrane biosynthesis protein TonB